MFLLLQDDLVVTLNDAFDVLCAAITDFDGVTVKDLVQLMMFWEMFIDKFQEVSPNICCYVFAERWVKPNYVSLSIFQLVFLF